MPKGRKGSPISMSEGVWKARATSGIFHGENKGDEKLRGIMVVREKRKECFTSVYVDSQGVL